MNMQAYMIPQFILLFALIAMVFHVWNTRGAVAALFSMGCPLYAIREVVRAGRQNRSLLVGAAAVVVSTSMWVSMFVSTDEHDLTRAISEFAGADPMAFTWFFAPIFFGVIWLVGVQWLAMIAFDREGWLPGFVAIFFWPYGMYYGIKRYSMNSMPVILSVTGLSGWILSVLLPLFLGSGS